ncbi:MAG TPA: GAF domain-containing protein [Candidatus Sulfotelmatobacter sp.]|nr:GAF domain-containing protein [Candidatus Sulfotelmatobacter sp.]
MSSNSTLALSTPNRRRRVRHKIQTPAYASFNSDPQQTKLDLHEIVDISEDGMAIQCHSPLEIKTQLNLCLDLADCAEQIYTAGQVIWSDDSGRAGLRFSDLAPDSLARLREWLFVNVMAGVANGETEIDALSDAVPPRPNYTDTLAAVSVVQRQVESLGSDLSAALKLIADRALELVRASGAAIALAEKDPDFMVCRASAGNDAPPIGARLQVGSGFSGECVKAGRLLRCDDAETDARVDRESCRALGIRSILAAPVRSDGKSIGLIEAFATGSNAFSEIDGRVLQRFADTVLAAVNRAAGSENSGSGPSSAPGGVLFASINNENEKADDKSDEERKGISAISLPRAHLIILACAAGTIFLALGYHLAPWVQTEATPWIAAKIHSRANAQLPTVLASSPPEKTNAVSPETAAIDSASFDQLTQMAHKGDPAAQNALGLRYATGDGVKLNELEAVRWFTKAAEQGNVPAQSKLGSIYFSGRGVPADPNRAYFWMVVARLSGDEASKTLSPFVRARLTRAQVAAIELDADHWLQQHRADKPPAGQLKARN